MFEVGHPHCKRDEVDEERRHHHPDFGTEESDQPCALDPRSRRRGDSPVGRLRTRTGDFFGCGGHAIDQG